MVTELNDAQLLARIVGGDLIAMEVKYHLKCMVNEIAIAVLSGSQIMMHGFILRRKLSSLAYLLS